MLTLSLFTKLRPFLIQVLSPPCCLLSGEHPALWWLSWWCCYLVLFRSPQVPAWPHFSSSSVLGLMVLSCCSAITSMLTTHKFAFPTLPHAHKSLQNIILHNPTASSRATWTKLSTLFLTSSTLPLSAFLHYFLNFSSLPLPPLLPGQQCQHYFLFFCYLLLTCRLTRFSEFISP